MTNFDLSQEERATLYTHVIKKLENYYQNTSTYPVTPVLDKVFLKNLVREDRFSQPLPKTDALQFVLDGLQKYAVHTPHPGYFGLFNPRSNFAGILADLITAVMNPQMAAWSHSPFAAEIEDYLISQFGQRFGYPKDQIDGVFAAGGAEANLTAVLCALNAHFPTFATEGLWQLEKKPMIYCSAEAHHSIVKAARAVGLGYHSVVNIPTDDKQCMQVDRLRKRIEEDQRLGLQPFMIAATAGTTGSGGIDNLATVAEIAAAFQCWFHVDAAYGGAMVLHPELKALLHGIASSDSITFDAHKWLSVPMATSLFITSHPQILSQSFRVSAEYMPKEGKDLPIIDPFTHSLQWSRRFIGLKLYLSLLFFGWEGYAEVIEHQVQMGNYLKAQLQAHQWSIKNDTPLPIVCFTDIQYHSHPGFISTIHHEVLKNRTCWISQYPIDKRPTLRACITNYATQKKDIDELVRQLNKARIAFRAK